MEKNTIKETFNSYVKMLEKPDDKSDDKPDDNNSEESLATINITPLALQFIQNKLIEKPEAIGLRLSLSKGGCSGSKYNIDFAKECLEGDNIIEKEGIKIIIHQHEMKFFNHTIIDCVKDDFGEYLKFLNPNVKGECGCGESISFEN